MKHKSPPVGHDRRAFVVCRKASPYCAETSLSPQFRRLKARRGVAATRSCSAQSRMRTHIHVFMVAVFTLVDVALPIGQLQLRCPAAGQKRPFGQSRHDTLPAFHIPRVLRQDNTIDGIIAADGVGRVFVEFVLQQTSGSASPQTHRL